MALPSPSDRQINVSEPDAAVDLATGAATGAELDLFHLVRLHEIGAKSVEADNLGHLLREVLETVIGVTHADFGTIQLVDRSSKRLRIVTERGLPEAFVSFFDTTDNAGGACGAALERGTRIVVEDVRMASEYTETSRRVMLDSGILACQSTPLLSRGGGMLGIISTHFRSPHRCTEKELQFVDLLARHAADFIEYGQRRHELEEIAARERIARARADAANRSKDQFLAMLAHELRQPLSAAFPAIEVQKRSLSPERRQRADEVIEEQLAHIARLVEDLAYASRMMRGTIDLQREHVDLRTIVQQALNMASPLIHRHQHVLRMELADDPIQVSGDPTRLKQVFANLLQNAAAYTPPHGRIEGTLSVEGDQAIFRLRDNGIGIPAACAGSHFRALRARRARRALGERRHRRRAGASPGRAPWRIDQRRKRGRRPRQ